MKTKLDDTLAASQLRQVLGGFLNLTSAPASAGHSQFGVSITFPFLPDLAFPLRVLAQMVQLCLSVLHSARRLYHEPCPCLALLVLHYSDLLMM